jgi:flagellar hook-basal body complex protein FliE
MIDDPVRIAPAPIERPDAPEPARPAAGGEFDELLSKATAAVLKPEQEATQAIAAFEHGTEGRLHETMLAVDKAEISLKLLVGVRNRLLDSYREIMRMGG